MKDDWKHAARRLAAIRGAHKLTQEDAADIAGVTVRTWRKWESSGRGPISMAPLTKFGMALDISLDWIFDGQTIEDRRKEWGPLAMDVVPDLKAKHRAKIEQLRGNERGRG